MNKFMIWMVLIFGIWFIISSTIGLYNDVSNRQSTKWWRWILDPLGLIVGIWFILEFCYFY